MTDATSPGATLREHVEGEEITVMPGCFDALSARLVEQAGFDTVFTSGFGLSASALGLPDMGFLDRTANLDEVREIARRVDVPLVADLDTGYGNALNVRRSVAEAIEAGAAGVILEDQEWPKRCGHMDEKSVVPADEHATRIRAAADARDEADEDLVIVGRTDARYTHGLEEAIERGRAYEEAGADVVFVEAPEDREEMTRIAEAFDAPTFANMVEGGKTPYLPPYELAEIGYDFVVYPVTTLFAATKGMQDALATLREEGTAGDADTVSFADFEAVVGTHEFGDLERRYAED
ncbi:MAG: oxaloacetate decarboxylase [Haloferacaceae archaeon]